MSEKTQEKSVIFLHPDLGIGGAERLVVDAAVGLQNRGHKVVIFTSHCDPQHCFDEARDGNINPIYGRGSSMIQRLTKTQSLGTLDVRVRGNAVVPSSIFSRFSILCAILRQLHLILQVYLNSELRQLQVDAFFVDQLSAGLPLLKYLQPKAPILFYCHFPDLLLAQGRSKLWKRLYRIPFDAWEQWSMSYADVVAVNSNFTKGVATATWPALAQKKELEVVYPCIDLQPKKDTQAVQDGPLWADKRVILSINRFERKKDIALAINAYSRLSIGQRKGARLVIAGMCLL